jgi:3-hydroxyisobutyrate dehydrogenase-like beta-hydroxyacid dehydrogenase
MYAITAMYPSTIAKSNGRRFDIRNSVYNFNMTDRGKEPLGLIGLGLLGSAMAKRFLGAGFAVVGYDVIDGCRAGLRELGGEAVSSACEVAGRCRRIVLSLPNSEVAATVLEEIRPRLGSGMTVVDTTTGEPEQVSRLGASLAGLGVRYLDATVGGSSRVVSEGEAIVMVGGEAGAYQANHDLFDSFARRSFHVGPWGNGARMKLVFNLVLGLNRAVLAEGLTFAGRCGLDKEMALEVLKSGPAYSRVMDAKGAKMLAGDFTPEARLSQHLKDVRLILEAAKSRGARVPLSTLHKSLLERAEAAGYGASDNSAVIKSFE